MTLQAAPTFPNISQAKHPRTHVSPEQQYVRSTQIAAYRHASRSAIMVSLWPFGRSDSSSAASFEKQLSQLSTRINRYASQSETLRSKQRRYKALWTLYSGFAYILIAAILTLVTGWDKWSAPEYTAVAGGPVLIYGVRKALGAWYEYRLQNAQTRLDETTKEREKVIKKLKEATKYDSTQQLLDKYGGGSPKQERGKSPSQGKRKPSARQSLPAQFQPGQRTGFAPPPTANIQGRQPPPQNPVDAKLASASGAPPPAQGPGAPGESFAPNAFPSRPPPPSSHNSQYAPPSGPAWYDRLMDIVLGEDETQAKNRFVLICANCRLVNGQAPPGTRTLEEVGKWRCKECGTMNGVESEVGKVLEHAEKSGMKVRAPVPAVSEEDLKTEEHEESPPSEQEEVSEGEAEPELVDTPPAGSTRSKARQRKKA